MRRPSRLLSALVVGWLLPPAILAAEPWRDALFLAPPTEILAAANAVRPASADVHVLSRDVSYTFTSDHRATFRQVLVYQLLTEKGLETFGATEVRFSPWHQERPRIRARVSTPAGEARELDPLEVDRALRSAAASGDETRVLRLDLPGVSPGAVVEEEIVIRDRSPYFSAGRVYVHRLAMAYPVRSQRLTLEAPTLLPLRYGVRLVDGLEPRRQIEGGTVRLVFEDGPRPAASAPETGLPAHISRFPHIAFSTGSDWSSVVDDYLEGFEKWRGSLEWPADFDRSGPRPEPLDDRILRLLARLRDVVRPDPTPLDELPALPRKIAWGPGPVSGLEFAALAAELLRQDGIPARVALVRRGLGRDVESNLPGAGALDHALIVVPGEGSRDIASQDPKPLAFTGEKTLWLDPADPLVRPGQLAPELQGRRALVLAPGNDRFVLTPVSSSADNRTEVEIEIELAATGPGRVVETSRFFGVSEWLQRRLSLGLDDEERRRGYADYARLTYRAEALGELAEGDPADLSTPYWLRLEALRAGRALSDGSRAVVGISIADLLLSLPPIFFLEAEPRRQDFSFPYAYEIEWRLRVTAPRGFESTSIPRDEVWSLGSVRIEQSFSRHGEAVEARIHFDSGPKILTSEQFEETRFKVHELWRQEGLVVEFERR